MWLYLRVRVKLLNFSIDGIEIVRLYSIMIENDGI